MATRATRLHIDMRKARRCLSQKVGFPNKDHALHAAEIAMEAGHVNPGCHLTPYLCNECGEWHFYNRRIVWPSV